MTRVGLIGPPDREELVRLAMRIEERSSEALFLDSRADPAIEIGPTEERILGIDLAGLSAFYVADLGIRSPLPRRGDGSIDRERCAESLASSRRHLAAWNALLTRLARRARVINTPDTHELHGLKPWEMANYERHGVPVPWTVATSDPSELAELGGRPEELVRKSMVGGYDYTEPFTAPSTREAARDLLSSRALMVQERVEGDNVRAFVLDGRVLGAAEILTRSGEETDSRRGGGRVRRVELPVEAQRAATEAAALWGLSFAAVDFMSDERSKHHLVLECNSAPFFVEFERRTGIDVSGALADALLERRRR